MTYDVLWSSQAERELVALLTNPVDPEVVARAAVALDQQLRTEPDQLGESRPYGARITFEPPLGITFEVRWRQQLVRVLHVWRFRMGNG